MLNVIVYAVVLNILRANLGRVIFRVQWSILRMYSCTRILLSQLVLYFKTTFPRLLIVDYIMFFGDIAECMQIMLCRRVLLYIFRL